MQKVFRGSEKTKPENKAENKAEVRVGRGQIYRKAGFYTITQWGFEDSSCAE